MADYRPRSSNVPKGLETTRDTSSSRLAWVKYENSRTAQDSDQRRAGYKRLYRFAAPSVLMDFDGTNDFVSLWVTDARVNPFGTVFTLETLFQTDDISSNRVILGRAAAGVVGVTITHTTSSTVTTVVEDSAGTTTTLTHTGIAAGTLCAYQLVRDGATLTAKINGTTQTGTMSATLSLRSGAPALGKDNAGSFYDGRIDFIRVLRYAKTNQYDGWARLVDPRSPGVLVEYVIEPDANGTVMDRGALGIHGATTGSPAINVAPLAVNPMPVLGIASNLDKNFKRQAYIRVAGTIYPASWL